MILMCFACFAFKLFLNEWWRNQLTSEMRGSWVSGELTVCLIWGRGRALSHFPRAGPQQPPDRWNGTSAFPGKIALAPCLHKSRPCGIPVKSANCAPIKEDWRTQAAAEQCVCTGSACGGTLSSRKIKCKKRHLWKINSRANKINSS